MASNLKTMMTYKFNADTQQAEKSIDRLEKSFKGLQSQLSKDVQQLTRFANQTAKTSRSTNRVNKSIRKSTKLLEINSNSIVRTIRRWESFAVAIYGVKKAYEATVGAGIEFNREMEDVGVTIGAIIASTSQNKTTKDAPVDEAEKWKIALDMASRYKKMLVELNPETPLGLKDTTKIFQILLPQMRQYNATVEQEMELTKLFSIATRTGNLSMVEMKAALDGIIGGTARSNSELMVYLNSLGITSKKLKELAKSGKSIEFLIEKMKGLEGAGELLKNTMSGQLTALKNEWDTLMGAATDDLFNSFKSSIGNLTEYLHENRDEWIVTFRTFLVGVQDIGVSLSEVYQSIKDNLNSVLEFAGIDTTIYSVGDAFVYLSKKIRENKDIIAKTVLAYGAFVIGGTIYSGVTGIIGLVARLTGVVFGLGRAMKVASGASIFMSVGGVLATGVQNIAILMRNLSVTTMMSGSAWETFKIAALTSIDSIKSGLSSLLSYIRSVASALSGLAGLASSAVAAGAGAAAGIAASVNHAMKKADIQGGKVLGLTASELEQKIKYLTGLQAKGETGNFGSESTLQNILNRTVDQYVKVKLKADDATQSAAKFKKVLGDTVAAGDKVDIGKTVYDRQKAKFKAEMEAAKKASKAYDELMAKTLKQTTPGSTTHKKTPAEKALERQQKLRERYQAKFQDRLYKDTHDKYEYEKHLIEEKYAKDIAMGIKADQAKMARDAALANLEQKHQQELDRQAKRAARERASVWKKGFQDAKLRAGSSCKDGNCGAGASYMTGAQAKKAAEEAGKTFGGSFKDAIAGSKAKQDYKSIGADLGSAFGSAIRGALQDYVNGNGEITLKEASRKQFDSQIGGLIRSKYPMVGLAADIFSAINTESKNSFQRMEVNIDKDNTGIADSISRLHDVMYPELSYTKKMLTQLEDMNSNFGSIAKSLTANTDFSGINYNKEDLSSGDIFKNGKLISYQHGGNGGGIGDIVSGLVQSIFGSTTKTLERTGIGFGEQTAESFMNGLVDGYSYKVEKIKKKALFGLVNSTKFKTTKEDLSAEVEKNFSDAMNTGYDLILSAMNRVGAKSNGLEGITFKEKVIDAKGMTEEEYQKAVTGLMTARLDTLTKGLWSDIDQFTRAGEKSFEAGIRIATGVDQATYALDRLGVKTVKYNEVLNKQAENFGGELARTSIVYAEGTTGIGKFIEGMRGTTEEVVKAYKAAKDFQFAMRYASGSMAEFTQGMVDGAGSLDALVTGQQEYFSNFFTDQEQADIQMAKLNKQFETLGVTLPKTKQDFRKLLENLEKTKGSNEALNKQYGRLITLSGAYAKAIDAEEKAKKKAADSMKSLIDLWLGKYSPLTLLQKTAFANRTASLAANNPNYNAVDTAKQALETAYKSAVTQQDYIREFNRLNRALEKDVKDATNQDIVNELKVLHEDLEDIRNATYDGNDIARSA